VGARTAGLPVLDDPPRYETVVSLMRQRVISATGLITPVVPLQEGPAVFRLIEDDPGAVIKFAVTF